MMQWVTILYSDDLGKGYFIMIYLFQVLPTVMLLKISDLNVLYIKQLYWNSVNTLLSVSQLAMEIACNPHTSCS